MPYSTDKILICIKGGDIATVLDAGLPEITGSLKNFYGTLSSSADGAFKISYIGLALSSGIETGLYTILFSASDSDSIYGNSDTVQPPALQLIPQIKF